MTLPTPGPGRPGRTRAPDSSAGESVGDFLRYLARARPWIFIPLLFNAAAVGSAAWAIVAGALHDGAPQLAPVRVALVLAVAGLATYYLPEWYLARRRR